MKKIKILPSVSILCLALGVSFVSASEVGLIATIQGSPMVFLSVSSGNKSDIYSDRNNVETKKIASNGTITEEEENSTTTKSNGNNKNSLISLVSTSTANFEINGDDERSKENRGTIISEAAKVLSGDDLHLFVQSIVNKNKDIASISSKEDRVSITRNVPTKLFWFIPLTTKETASVISWGDGTTQVSVTRPWWNFFSKYETTIASTTADIELGIKNIQVGEWKATLDASTKARIISEIQNAFQNRQNVESQGLSNVVLLTTTQTSPITTVVGAVYDSVFVKNATTFLFIDNNSKTWIVNYQNANFSEISITTGIADKTNGLLTTTLKDWIKEQRPVGDPVYDGPGAPGTITIIGTLDASGTLIASDIKVNGQ